MSNFNEADHPRDEIGRFTYKGGGSSSTSTESYERKDQSREDILYPTMNDKNNGTYRNKLLNFLGNSLDRAEILYSREFELENKILNNTIERVSSLKDKLGETITNLKNNIQQKYNKNADKVLKEAEKWDNAAGDFARNYNDMVEANTKYSDKYFHAKANCQASQRGLGGEVISHALSLSREIEEGIRKVILEGKDPIKQIKRCRWRYESQ